MVRHCGCWFAFSPPSSLAEALDGRPDDVESMSGALEPLASDSQFERIPQEDLEFSGKAGSVRLSTYGGRPSFLQMDFLVSVLLAANNMVFIICVCTIELHLVRLDEDVARILDVFDLGPTDFEELRRQSLQH